MLCVATFYTPWPSSAAVARSPVARSPFAAARSPFAAARRRASQCPSVLGAVSPMSVCRSSAHEMISMAEPSGINPPARRQP